MLSLLLTITLFSAPPDGPFHTKTPDTAYIFIQHHSTDDLYIMLTNDYGDEEVYHFSKQNTIGIPLTKFCFANLMITGRPFQLPCFPGDTTVYDFNAGGLKFHTNHTTLLAYDTTFFPKAWSWNRPYYNTTDSLFRLLNDGNTQPLQAVNRNVPGFQRINQQLFSNDSALQYQELSQLDSLYHSGEISEVFYEAYRSNLMAQFIDMSLSRFNFTNDRTYLDKIKTLHLQSDYLYCDATGLYKRSLRHFIDNRIGKNNYLRVNSHELALDYTALYDSCSHYLSSRLLDLARYICLNKIKQYNTPKTLELYIHKWMEQTNDESFKVYATRNFEPKEVNASEADDVTTYERKKINLGQLFKKFAGRKVYIDLWASWCLPCINSIEASRQQVGAIDTSAAVVVYLSLDQDQNAWLQASARLGLTAADRSSYRIVNARSCHFLEQIKLTTIPRYLLLDKEGKIIDADAPDPDSIAFPGLLGSPARDQRPSGLR